MLRRLIPCTDHFCGKCVAIMAVILLTTSGRNCLFGSSAEIVRSNSSFCCQASGFFSSFEANRSKLVSLPSFYICELRYGMFRCSLCVHSISFYSTPRISQAGRFLAPPACPLRLARPIHSFFPAFDGNSFVPLIVDPVPMPTAPARKIPGITYRNTYYHSSVRSVQYEYYPIVKNNYWRNIKFYLLMKFFIMARKQSFCWNDVIRVTVVSGALTIPC